MKVKQLSVFLENKPGALSPPVKLLAKAKLNLLTLSLADTQQFGILRFMVREWAQAKTLLEEAGFVVTVTDLVAVEVSDQPGGLATILAVVEKAGVNLEYMYGFTLQEGRRSLLVFRFDDPDKAAAALARKGLNPLAEVELFKRMSQVPG